MLVEPYNPRWPQLFAEISGLIQRAIPGTYYAVEHVGGTAVPGLSAKPIIDIDVVMREGQWDKVRLGLEGLGYVHQGDKGIAGREAFDLRDAGLRSALAPHHLYVCPHDSLEVRRHRAFRDFLIAHPEWAEKLSAHKREVAELAGDDRQDYQAGKSAMVEEILALALQETRPR